MRQQEVRLWSCCLLVLLFLSSLVVTTHSYVATTTPLSSTSSISFPATTLFQNHYRSITIAHSSHQRRGGVGLEYNGRRVPSSNLYASPMKDSSMGIPSSDEEEGNEGNEEVLKGRRNFLKNGRAIASTKIRQTAQAARRMFRRALLWHRSKGRKLITAAALALSMLLVSQDQIGNYVSQQPSQTTATTAEINRVVPSQLQKQSESSSVSLPSSVSRGGGGAVAKKQSKSKQLLNNVEEGVASASKETKRTLLDALDHLQQYMTGPKADTLFLLLATALVTPVCKKIGMSPILGFLAAGMWLGPNGYGLISGIHTTETLAELGIVFFLFEMVRNGTTLICICLLLLRKSRYI